MWYLLLVSRACPNIGGLWACPPMDFYIFLDQKFRLTTPQPPGSYSSATRDVHPLHSYNNVVHIVLVGWLHAFS